MRSQSERYATKLDLRTVRRIKRRLEKKNKPRGFYNALCKEFKISRTMLYYIRTGQRWPDA